MADDGGDETGTGPAAGRDWVRRKGSALRELERLQNLRERASPSFVAALMADFEAHGAAAIAHARETRTATYLRLAAALLPKVSPEEEAKARAERDTAIRRMREEDGGRVDSAPASSIDSAPASSIDSSPAPSSDSSPACGGGAGGGRSSGTPAATGALEAPPLSVSLPEGREDGGARGERARAALRRAEASPSLSSPAGGGGIE